MRTAATAILLLLAGCSDVDGEYFLYRMIGLDVWVHSEAAGSLYGGRIDAFYLSRKFALAQCASLAFAVAHDARLEDCGYVCCTVTSSSQCSTTVR
jgi:hypothetical protein